MANNIAFQPMGPCVLVQPSAANTQSNVITITAFSPVQQYSLINTDTSNAVFIEISASPTFNVAVPTSAGSNVYPVPAFVILEPKSESGHDFGSFNKITH